MIRYFASITGAVAVAALAACSGGGVEDAEDDLVEESAEPLKGPATLGKILFDNALPTTNGRSCATCHAASDHMGLNAASAEARYQANPSEPLFHPLDADDPAAATLTYDHLRKGLVRVGLSLAANLDVIDDAGNVITNADRTITVWRGVPTIENVALTVPYLSDGRAATLEEQAGGALRAHSELPQSPPYALLEQIARYEETVVSSPGVAAVIKALDDNHAPPDPDPPFAAGSAEASGKAVFQVACAACHGGPRGNEITNRAAADALFVALNPDGTAQMAVQPDNTTAPVLLGDHQSDTFLNIGISFGAYRRVVSPPVGTTPLPMPHYRLRFYTDATRTQKVVDLPPPMMDPVTGQPLSGPNLSPQAFTVDPGRAVISGDPADFEAFDVPQLRGCVNTAPYFHDNSKSTLESVVEFYSRFFLRKIPALGLPAVIGQPPESLSATQKAQLVAYLKKI